jgi:hypothetical protein
MATTQRQGTGRSATFVDSPFRNIVGGVSALLPSDQFATLNAAAGAITLTLPSTANVVPGKNYWLIRTDSVLANAVTIAPVGGQTINGAASAQIILQYSSIYVVSDGSNWFIFAGPGSFVTSSDVLWAFPGQLSTDQDSSIFELKFKRAASFVAFDADVRVASSGADILVDWLKNGIVVPALRVTIPAGSTYAQTVVPAAFAVDDLLRPSVVGVGSQTPGQSLIMRARGV